MLIDRLKNEPAVVIAALAAALLAALGPLDAAQLISPELSATIQSILNPDGYFVSGLVLVVGWLIRRKVFGPKTAAELRDSFPPGYVPPGP